MTGTYSSHSPGGFAFVGDAQALRDVRAGDRNSAQGGHSAHTLLFGLDANTYEVGDNIKYQQVLDFAAAYGAAGYTSCWGDAPRVNRLIFIGKNLDREELKKGFEACLETTGK